METGDSTEETEKMGIKESLDKCLEFAAEHAHSNNHQVRKYPDEVKIMGITLRSSGMSYREVGKRLNVPYSCVHDWCNGEDIDQLSYSDVAEQYKSRLKNKLYIGANIAFSASLKDDKIEKASALQLSTMGSQMIDKARLLSGESTDNVAMVYKKKVELSSASNGFIGNSISLEAKLAMMEEVES